MAKRTNPSVLSEVDRVRREVLRKDLERAGELLSGRSTHPDNLARAAVLCGIAWTNRPDGGMYAITARHEQELGDVIVEGKGFQWLLIDPLGLPIGVGLEKTFEAGQRALLRAFIESVLHYLRRTAEG